MKSGVEVKQDARVKADSRALESVVAAFKSATAQFESIPEDDEAAGQIANRLQLLASNTLETCAVDYMRALRFRSPVAISRMTEIAVYDSKSRAIEYVPQALETIFIVTKESQALRELAALHADGAPGETQDFVMLELIPKYPREFSKVAYEMYEGDVKRAMQDENGFGVAGILKYRLNDPSDKALKASYLRLAAKLESGGDVYERFFGKLIRRAAGG